MLGKDVMQCALMRDDIAFLTITYLYDMNVLMTAFTLECADYFPHLICPESPELLCLLCCDWLLREL